MKRKTELGEKMEVCEPCSDDDDDSKELQRLNRIENRKNRKSGGFQSMGLSNPVFRGIIHRGYKLPTPIQRKTIPLILDGKDVVAMARTGSGKTGAFIIPMLEKLKAHDPSGIRAVILSPTKELALQTFKFAKELGKFAKLMYATVLGGDRIEDQFNAFHSNPDVLIATPGRLMHVLSEMNLKLTKVEYIVFDEADRLFEMNFQEQLNEILSRLPEMRQTLLFSATLPKMLIDFAAAGLNSPELVRLDVDTKLSEQLSLYFFECRSDDKMALLLHLMRNVVKPSQPTFIFAATKHHVEYINMVLTKAGFACSMSYGSLDPLARSIHVERFRNRRTSVCIVTDLAARGIDIPMLDNVINFNFPAKPKLFLHRVGRVARAGRSGSAYSIVSLEEKAYVLDLHVFLGRPVKYTKESYAENKDERDLYGLVPQSIVDDGGEELKEWNKTTDFQSMMKVVSNGYKHYVRTRPAPSSESIKRVKALSDTKLGYHPIFGSQVCDMSRENLLEQLRNYKSQTLKSSNNVAQVRFNLKNPLPVHSTENADDSGIPTKKRKVVKDEEFFMNYVSKDHDTEKGLELDTGFAREASKCMLDLRGDDEEEMKKQKNRMVWDRKKKKFVRDVTSEKKKGRNEAGVKITGKPKKDLYKTWLERKKTRNNVDEESDNEKNYKSNFKHFAKRRGDKNVQFEGRGAKGKGKGKPRSELKRKEQIVKKRETVERTKNLEARQAAKKQSRKRKDK